MQSKNILRIILATAFILLIPFIAMQFTNEVNWDLTDFVTIGALLLGTGLAYDLIAKKMDKKYRVILGVVFMIVLLLIWVELAVGLFGTPFAGS